MRTAHASEMSSSWADVAAATIGRMRLPLLICMSFLLPSGGELITGPCMMKYLITFSNLYLRMTFDISSPLLEVTTYNASFHSQYEFDVCYYRHTDISSALFVTLRNKGVFAHTCQPALKENCTYFLASHLGVGSGLTFVETDERVTNAKDTRLFSVSFKDAEATFRLSGLLLYLSSQSDQSGVHLSSAPEKWRLLPIVSYVGSISSRIFVQYAVVTTPPAQTQVGQVGAQADQVTIWFNDQDKVLCSQQWSANSTLQTGEFEVLGFQGYTRVSYSSENQSIAFETNTVYALRVPNSSRYLKIPTSSGALLNISGWYDRGSVRYVEPTITEYNATFNLHPIFANSSTNLAVQIESQSYTDSRFFVVERVGADGRFARLRLANYPEYYLAVANRQRLIATQLLPGLTSLNYDFFIHNPPWTRPPEPPHF